jgi:uncharacterized protein (DUF1684 family)
LGKKKGGEIVMEISEWERDLERERGRKGAFFAQHWQSLIPPQDRPRFKGLEYYPPHPSYSFEPELHEHPEKQVAGMAYTKGNEQDFLRWAEFRFKIGGEEQAIEAYNPWCVYSEAHTCPFVPIENWLEVPILAGEENYPSKRGRA